MALLDFGTDIHCNLVVDKQKNVYINAYSGVGRIFSWGDGCTKGTVSIQVIFETCNGGGACKVVGALKSHKFAVQYK